MAGNILAIEFRRSVIKAGAFMGKAGGAGFKIFSAAMIGEDVTATLKGLLNEMAGAGIKDIRRVVVGVDPSLLSLRVIDTPFADNDRRKIDEILPLELSDALMEDSEAYVFSSIALENKKTLVAALEKSMVAKYLSALRECGLEPDWITSPLFLKDAFIGKDIVGGVSAFIDNDSLAVVSGDRKVFYKAVSSEEDLALAFMSLKADGVEVEKFYAAEGLRLDRDLFGAEVAVIAGLSANETGVRALLNAALNRNAPEMDFRSGEFADIREASAIKRGLKAAIGFMFLIVILWGAHFYIMTGVYASEAVKLDNRMREAYGSLFPGEEAGGDFVYRMKAKLTGMERDAEVVKDDAKVLAVLREIAIIGGKGAVVTSLSIKEGLVIINGEAETRESAEVVRVAVEESPLMARATLSNAAEVKNDASKKKATFTITAELEGAVS